MELTDNSLIPDQIPSLLSFLLISQNNQLSFKNRLLLSQRRRRRRGLFSFIGDVTSFLLGITTHGELDTRFGDYERPLGSVVTKVKGTSEAIHSATGTLSK